MEQSGPEARKTVAVDDLLYSQQECSDHFTDTRHTFEELLQGLNSWSIDPLTSRFLELEVVEVPGLYGELRMHSNDNRRLYCLKQHQEHVRPWIVKVNVRCTRLPAVPAIQRCFARRDLTDGGRSIRVRRRSSSPPRRRF